MRGPREIGALSIFSDYRTALLFIICSQSHKEVIRFTL
jgi:hypothetical protein